MEMKFKIGDKLEIATLFSKSHGREMSGIIGHVGKVIDISGNGFYTLDPLIIGHSWPEDCLKFAEEKDLIKYRAKNIEEIIL